MSGINHITGGIIFTGIFSSFWDINIFSKVEYLLLSTFASVLPDIDHTRSPIGKAFYPIARYLDINFGHRTITHSLLGLTILLLIIITLERIYPARIYNFSLIFTFSYASHLIFDMMTKEGVPLLYPFNKNSCVIPGDSNKRLKSGNFKTECIIFCLLIPIGISCKSLFEQGFWTTFDRAFGTLKHIHYEFIKSNQLIKLSYEANHMGKKYQGQGYVVYTKPNKAIIFNKNGFLELNQDFQISKLIPIKTNIKYQTEDICFHDISLEKLHRLIHNKPIIVFTIQANAPICYTHNNKVIVSSQINLDYILNPQLIWEKKENPAIIEKKNALQFKLETLQKGKKIIESKKMVMQSRITNLSNTMPKLSNYERQKATEELKNLKKEIEKLSTEQYQTKIESINISLQQLQSQPKPVCSGYIQYLVLPLRK